MSDKIFNSIWLKERFRFDNAARNQLVETAFFDSILGKEKVEIIDLGSGTGANCLYFFDKIEKDQTWFLIEKDHRFIEPTFQRLIDFAKRNGYKFHRRNASLFIETNQKEVEINFLSESFFELDELVDLENVDVVMAAALFDILSETQFVTLADTIFFHQTPLFTTMNYTGMSLKPLSKEDEKYINLYDAHMRRLQDFGRGMGNSVVTFMEGYFLKNGFQLFKGESVWYIDETAFTMQEMLLNFIENAVKEMLKSSDEQILFDTWVAQKRKLSQQQLLAIEVKHVDFFVLPTSTSSPKTSLSQIQ